MTLINFFRNNKVECPRCLGKGHVDWEDITRLKNELKWRPGKCAYCDGVGKINPENNAEIAVNNAYLTSDLPEHERKMILKNDPGARARAEEFETNSNTFILQVEYLYFIGNLDAQSIATFFLLPNSDQQISSDEKEALIDYIEQIVAYKKANN